MSNSVRGIVAGHGNFAPGIISAVEAITGVNGALVAISNTGLSASGIEAALRDALVATGAKAVFTDLPAGSCTMCARRLAKALPGVSVVTGVTLPTLLAFVLGADVREAIERGRESILLVEDGGAP